MAAADDYFHYNDPDCPLLSAGDCSDLPYCQKHRSIGNLFTSRSGILKVRDFESPSEFTTQQSNIPKKRSIKSIHCGVLSEETQSQVSSHIINLIPGSCYDIVTDYPYNGAEGGDNLDPLFSFPFPPPLFSSKPSPDNPFCGHPLGIIGVFVRQYERTKCLGSARTEKGGVRLTFQAVPNAFWYQVIFLVDDGAGAVDFYIQYH